MRPAHCVSPGCAHSFSLSRFAAIRAQEDGWFRGKDDSDNPGWHCPEHVPAWVPAWRARKAAQQHKVSGSVEHLGIVYACAGGCEETTWPAGPAAEALATEIRARAFDHARQTGHTVSVTVARRLTVSPQ